MAKIDANRMRFRHSVNGPLEKRLKSRNEKAATVGCK